MGEKMDEKGVSCRWSGLERVGAASNKAFEGWKWSEGTPVTVGEKSVQLENVAEGAAEREHRV